MKGYSAGTAKVELQVAHERAAEQTRQQAIAAVALEEAREQIAVTEAELVDVSGRLGMFEALLAERPAAACVPTSQEEVDAHNAIR